MYFIWSQQFLLNFVIELSICVIHASIIFLIISPFLALYITVIMIADRSSHFSFSPFSHERIMTSCTQPGHSGREARLCGPSILQASADGTSREKSSQSKFTAGGRSLLTPLTLCLHETTWIYPLFILTEFFSLLWSDMLLLCFL